MLHKLVASPILIILLILDSTIASAGSVQPSHAEKVEQLVYDEIIPLGNSNQAKVKRHGKWGYVDLKTNEVFVAIKYDEIDEFFFVGGQSNKKGVRTPSFRRALARYDEVKYDTGETAAVRVNDKWGIVGQHGKELIAPQYTFVGYFYNNVARVSLNGLWGFVDKTGQEIVSPIYADVKRFSEGMAAVAVQSSENPKQKLFGYVDLNGKMVIQPKYNLISEFHDGLALVYRNQQEMYVDKSGKEMMLPRYNSLSNFREGLAVVSKVNPKTKVRKYGFINTSGKEVIAPQFDTASGFTGDLALVSVDNRQFYIDKSGRPQKVLHIMAKGLARVRIGDKWGYIDRKGQEVFSVIYDELPDKMYGPFNRFQLNGKYGFLDEKANITIPAKYEEVPNDMYRKSSDLRIGRVRANGKYGYLSLDTGKEIAATIYDEAPQFHSYSYVTDKMKVKRDGKWGYINTEGKEISQFKYEDDPNAYIKRSGNHYIFGAQADFKAQPDSDSATIALLKAGTKVKVISRTGQEFTRGNVTDQWYAVKFQGKGGYVWGGALSDADCKVIVNGKKALVVIRNRTRDTDHSYHPMFEMQLVTNGKVVDQELDKFLNRGSIKIKSLKYKSINGFSAPLNLLEMVYEDSSHELGHAKSSLFYYLDEGHLVQVLSFVSRIKNIEGRIRGTLIMPDPKAGKDSVTVKYKFVPEFFGKKMSAEQYVWNWDKKKFIKIENKKKNANRLSK